MSVKATVITNIYNEEYLLPFWLEYHRTIFDHGIIIDYDSTDQSIEIVKKLCPTWEIRRTKNIVDGKVLFETFRIEEECKEIEQSVKDCYKIYLNTTEWLITNKPIKEILDGDILNKCYLLNVYVPLNDTHDLFPDTTFDFINGFNSKIVNAKTVRGYRFIFNRDYGYYRIGRHFTSIQSDYDVDMSISSLDRIGMCVFWCGYYPLNDKMWNRKLQIKTNMDKQIEYQPSINRNSAVQHFYSLDDMKHEYKEYLQFADVNNEKFKKAIIYAQSLL